MCGEQTGATAAATNEILGGSDLRPACRREAGDAIAGSAGGPVTSPPTASHQSWAAIGGDAFLLAEFSSSQA
jgi:hypothetical protein